MSLILSGAQICQPSSASGQLNYMPAPTRVVQNLNVRSRSIGWDAIVRMAEGNEYQAVLWYPVYQFGGGQVRRYFTQPV